ncbi:MAG: hypothetical protein ACO1SV_09645 [Fimbriimonas sp.]
MSESNIGKAPQHLLAPSFLMFFMPGIPLQLAIINHFHRTSEGRDWVMGIALTSATLVWFTLSRLISWALGIGQPSLDLSVLRRRYVVLGLVMAIGLHSFGIGFFLLLSR